MASTGNSNNDPNVGNYLSDQLQDLLDLAVLKKQADVFKSTLPDSEHTTLVALSNAQGFAEAVQFIYNKLPKDVQHGWNTRRADRRPKGAVPSGPRSGGGEGEPEVPSGDKKRRSPFRRPKGFRKSS